MNNATTALRNRVHPATEAERHLFDAERAADARTRDYVPGLGARYVWEDEGEPASGGQTAAVIGVIVCGALLLAGLAYLAWAGSHGGPPWTR